MKKPQGITPERDILQELYEKMHNWFWIGVIYDWDANKETGKMWVYKDCTGIEMKAQSLITIIGWLHKRYEKT